MAKMAGVREVTSGEPGRASQMAIRGGGSSLMSGGPPLYIVDGVPVDNIQNVNKNDVESFDILKDPSLTSMYGIRGSNGVVIIKTKSGNPDAKKKSGSLDNFVKGSTIRVRLEYVLRNALASETSLNVIINFRTASK